MGIKIVAVLAIAAIITLGFAGVTQHQQVFAQFPATEETTATETTSSADLLNAEAIYESNSITTDSDVENLVIVIPDSTLSQYGASPSSALFQGFLPANTTIVRGTNVTWINGDVNVTHGITVTDPDDEVILEESSIPYQNGTSFQFNKERQRPYTFTDPATGKTGTITVVGSSEEDDPNTNATKATVGLIVVPAYADARFSPHLQKLGFNAVSSVPIEGGGGAPPQEEVNSTDTTTTTGRDEGGLILYVWTQQESDAQTVINRFASKLRTLEEILYPGGEVKQS